jgi:hypothetical protein
MARFLPFFLLRTGYKNWKCLLQSTFFLILFNPDKVCDRTITKSIYSLSDSPSFTKIDGKLNKRRSNKWNKSICHRSCCCLDMNAYNFFVSWRNTAKLIDRAHHNTIYKVRIQFFYWMFWQKVICIDTNSWFLLRIDCNQPMPISQQITPLSMWFWLIVALYYSI